MGLSKKEWQKVHDVRKFSKELRRKRKRKALRKQSIEYRSHNKDQLLRNRAKKNKYRTMTSPTNFSIIENTNESIAFLNSIYYEIQKSQPIYFDIESVENLSIDSILYFLSLLRNLKAKGVSYSIRGNLPQNKSCRELLEASGFYNYVNSNSHRYNPNLDIIKIKDGSKAETIIPKQICDFVIEKFELNSNLKTRKLYEMILELILNTVQHAYNEHTNGLENWYIFCRYIKDKKIIKFSLLDTGEGIPATINKTKFEMFNLWLQKLKFTSKTQSLMIESALDGAYRTRTKLDNRGKGLPMIKALYNTGYIKNLVIVSDNALYSERIKKDNNDSLKGSLFSWEINKESIENGN